MREDLLYNYLIIFGSAALISYLGGFVVKSLARRLGIIDQPTPSKLHQQPTPRLGGLSIFLGFSISLVITHVWFPLGPARWAMLAGAALTMVIGAIDDLTARYGGVPAVIKLIVLFLITCALSQVGIIINFPLPYVVNLILTLIWLVAVSSAFNAMDNMDGLAGGLAVIAGGTYLAVAIQTGQWDWGFLAAAMVGANLGFLRHNFYPATLFMGDSGSFFLGFTLAALGIMGGWSTNPFKASLVPMIILGLPLFDLGYIIIRRHRAGLTHNLREIITYSGQDHFSHRVKAFGFSQKQTVLLIYLISASLSCGAFILRDTRRWEAVVLLVQFFLIMGIIFFFTQPKISKKEN